MQVNMIDSGSFPEDPPELSYVIKDKATGLWYSVSNDKYLRLYRASCLTDNQSFENYQEARQWVHTMMNLAL